MTFKICKYIIIPLLGTIICMVAIFLFSAQTTTESNKYSKRVVNQIVETTIKLRQADITEIKKNEIENKLNYVARKLMHATIFFVLGIFVFATTANIFTKRRTAIFFTLGICIACAITDEIHQLFVDGRTTQLLDVIIDTIGASIAIVVMILIKLIRRKTI